MGKGVILKSKEQENIYPVTASDLVYDPITKKNVKDELGGKVEEAPSDDKQYARINGTWAEVEAGAVSETALISITPALDDLIGVSVKVTTNEGDTVLDTTWQGATLSCQVRAGLQYTVAVGDKDGFIAPESVTYTAVKGASRTINMAYIESRLTVGILSNQENDTTIAAVKAVVAYGSTSVEVSNGESVNLPLNVDVTITFPAVEGYKAPDAITYSHTSGSYTKNGTYQTELVKVTLSADSGASVSGQVVTINGVAHTYGSTAVEQKVPFGTSYTVSVSDMDGFTTPSAQSFTAAESVRNLNLVYEEDTLGVFIMDVNRKLVRTSKWTNSMEACCVVVKNEDFSVGISLERDTDTYEWGGYGTFLSNVSAQYVSNNVFAVSNSRRDTSNIILGLKDVEGGAPAAQACIDYRFPNGVIGNLPDGKMWQMVLDNMTDVQNALTAAGGQTIYNSSPAYYWTTVQETETSNGANLAWAYRPYSTSVYTKEKNTAMYIRPMIYSPETTFWIEIDSYRFNIPWTTSWNQFFLVIGADYTGLLSKTDEYMYFNGKKIIGPNGNYVSMNDTIVEGYAYSTEE